MPISRSNYQVATFILLQFSLQLVAYRFFRTDRPAVGGCLNSPYRGVFSGVFVQKLFRPLSSTRPFDFTIPTVALLSPEARAVAICEHPRASEVCIGTVCLDVRTCI